MGDTEARDRTLACAQEVIAEGRVNTSHPLVIDLDRTFLRSDTLIEESTVARIVDVRA